jgi:hypothetical protein
MYIIAQAPAAAAITVAAGAATSAFTVIAGEPGAGTQCNLNLPGSNKLNGVPFIVRASGFMTLPAGTVTTAATPIQFELAASNTASFAVATGNVVASATAIAVFTYASAAATIVPWTIEVEYVGGGGASLLGKSDFITVDPNGVVGGAATPAATIHSPTSILWSAEPPVQFAAALISAAANNLPVGTTVSLTQFLVEA